MRRAYVDAAAVVVFTVVGSVLANAYTQAVLDDEATQTCRALVDGAAEAECPD